MQQQYLTNHNIKPKLVLTVPPELLLEINRSTAKYYELTFLLIFLKLFPPQRRSEEEALSICTKKPREFLLELRTPPAIAGF